jgi:methyl-accepting chemotaxis protein
MSNPAPILHAPPPVPETVQGFERLIVWVGSPTSLVLHTIVFVAFFAVSIVHLVAWELMLLVLTTAVSLEAIYLAIFIQMSVNRQMASLKEVEEDVGDIHQEIEELGENVEELGENVESLGENVEDLKEDVEDIQEDIGEIGDDDADEVRTTRQAQMLDALTNDVKAILTYLESMKAR